MDIVSRKPAEAGPSRMRPLSVLPVFLPLDGRPAVVAGTSAGAAWKAELIASAGARVAVYAAAPAAELETLADTGTVTLFRRAWTPADLTDAALAICDAADDAEAEAFFAAARAAGAPCNVVDRPAFCTVQFGSIVNRSPLVIGISTAGAAPVLAQTIRRRIEALLPAGIGAAVELAGRIRATVARRLPDAPARRAFWERFAERAFRAPETLDASVATFAEVAAPAPKTPSSGHVTIVGAGPGDADYLTLKAMRALQTADVILYDDLVSDDVLELARREAKRMMVGKRGGRASCKQEDINDLMVTLGRQGRRVVRLKSGDPMIFGRAGEEITVLEQAGIPVEVVPGISAAFGLAARLGVSLTHRDLARSVRFITAHARDGRMPRDLDWQGLADPVTTLVVYMGGRNAPELAANLMAAGLDAATPVVIAEGVSRPDERLARATVGELAANGVTAGDGPVLIGIGQCFGLARAELFATPLRAEAA